MLSVCFLLALSTLLFLHYCLGVHRPVSLSPFSHFSCVHQPVCFTIPCWLHATAWFGVSCFFLPSTSCGLQSVSVVALCYLPVVSTSLFVFWLRLICWLCPPVCVLAPSYLLVVSTSLSVFWLCLICWLCPPVCLCFGSVLFASCVQQPAPVFARCLCWHGPAACVCFFLCYLLAVSSRSPFLFLLCVFCWHCPPSCVWFCSVVC